MTIGSVFSRFFGRNDQPVETIALVANRNLENPPSLSVLFAGPLKIDATALGQRLRKYHPSMRSARADLASDVPQVFGLVGWDRHVVKLVGFDAPYPSESVEQCVAPAHYPQEVKARVRQNQSHVILYYGGFDEDPMERYVALAAVAGCLSDEGGGVAVLNEHAHSSLPAGIFSSEELGEESLDVLRSLPLTALFCGFVKYQIGGVQGVWMRTYGADMFGLPDFAVLAEGHHQGEQYAGMFDNIFNYLLESGAAMMAGNTMQIGQDSYMRLRAPSQQEYFLDGPGEVLVAEIIGAEEINQD